MLEDSQPGLNIVMARVCAKQEQGNRVAGGSKGTLCSLLQWPVEQTHVGPDLSNMVSAEQWQS